MKTVKINKVDQLYDWIICPPQKFTRILKEDLQNSKIIDSIIINEVVYRDEWFDNFFDYASKSRRLTEHSSSLIEYFDGAPAIQKTLRKHHGDLYLEFLNFKKADFYISLKWFTKDKVDENALIDKANDLYAKSKFSDGITVSFPDERRFALIYIDSSKPIVEQKSALKHEFIHYLEWLEGKHKQTYSVDLDYYEDELKLLHKHFGIYADHLSYATSSDEYITLLNSFMELLDSVRIKLYKDFSGRDFAVKIVELLFKKNDETNEEYLLRIKKLVFFNMLKDKPAFLLVVFFNMINEKVTNIKNHIFGYFNGN